jgi:hypothetical protein
MTPDQAARLMHERALILIDYAARLQNGASHRMSHAELLYCCLMIMNLYAESLWNMGDILETLGKEFDFTVDTLPMFEESANANTNATQNLDEPPFDREFFLNHRDFDAP